MRKLTLGLALAMSACGLLEPDAIDVTGEWIGARVDSYDAMLTDSTQQADSVTLYLLEALGSFVHGRWRGEMGDSIGSDFEAVVTGNISPSDMILEYHDPAGGLCRVAGDFDFSSRWTYEGRRRCEVTEWAEEAIYWFVFLAP